MDQLKFNIGDLVFIWATRNNIIEIIRCKIAEINIKEYRGKIEVCYNSWREERVCTSPQEAVKLANNMLIEREKKC